MTDEKIARHAGSEWDEFWQNLKEGYDIFEREQLPPNVRVENGRYVFDTPGDGPGQLTR